MEEKLRHGIELFNQREFFACHEVLEEIWVSSKTPRRLFLQSVIHVAVGFYHSQKGNSRGAQHQLRKGLKKLAAYLPWCEGINTAMLYAETRECLEQIETGYVVTAFPKIASTGNSGDGVQ